MCRLVLEGESERKSLSDRCLKFEGELPRAWSAGDASVLERRAGELIVSTARPEDRFGFLFLEARDLNEAVRLLAGHPGLWWGRFEIRPLDARSER